MLAEATLCFGPSTTQWANVPEAQFQADDYEGPGKEAVPYNPLGNRWQWA